ncbi:MAG: NAD(P)/FAD-dependent oxidoreductase, partial [Burkholderiaceae bacterium]|nr:NAD(P)/FAD-dependent oxidoreductase [Burkholderiaceae bacterium]
MTNENIKGGFSRRQILGLAGGGIVAGLLPLAGRADDKKAASISSTSSIALASTGIAGKRVVVVGGGMAGMTAAKYLRLWGGVGLQVTLIEPDALYTSNIMSNLVLNGSRSVSSLQYRRDALTTRYGVVRKTGRVVAIDHLARNVKLADGTTLGYDRLVLAPGVVFDDAYGLTRTDYESRTPHAWSAGPQTTLLRNQVAAMRDGDTFVMTIPRAPYRCPPGPYERACVVADYLKRAKGPNCHVVVLDENASIQAERHTFETAFNQIHAGVLQYVPGVSGIAIDAASKFVSYSDALGGTQQIQAQVINPIVPHRAT